MIAQVSFFRVSVFLSAFFVGAFLAVVFGLLSVPNVSAVDDKLVEPIQPWKTSKILSLLKANDRNCLPIDKNLKYEYIDDLKPAMSIAKKEKITGEAEKSGDNSVEELNKPLDDLLSEIREYRNEPQASVGKEGVERDREL